MSNMLDTDLVERVQGLTDVELAVLLSLVASQHCIIETEQDTIEALAEELQLVSNASVVRCPLVPLTVPIDCFE